MMEHNFRIPSEATKAEWGMRQPPEDWGWKPGVCKGIFVGGCVRRGIGSSFRRQAHAHTSDRDEHQGIICVRSHRRIYAAARLELNGRVAWTTTTKPSSTMWHEYAHLLAGPRHGHDDKWRAIMRELKQPIPEHMKKKKRRA